MSMVTTKGSADGQQVQPVSIGGQLKEKEGQFRAALPAHIPAERFMRVVMTAIQNNPKLANADRASLWTSSIKAAQDGLLPDGREGALVIYRTKSGNDWIEAVQWMPMIAGIRKKVRNSGEIATWDVQVVHARDHFEFELGDEPFIKHRPCTDGDPGPLIAAYSVAVLKSGEKSREVMSRAQIEKVRSASRSKDKGPWVDWYEEMARKTVARRHSKVLPMSTDLDDLIRRDDALYDLQGARDEARALAGGRPQTLAGKLDALAAGITKPKQADETPAETSAVGEAQQGSSTSDEELVGASTAEMGDDDRDGSEPTPRDLVLDKLRRAAMDSTGKLKRAFGGLTKEEQAHVKAEDIEALEKTARQAEGAAS